MDLENTITKRQNIIFIIIIIGIFCLFILNKLKNSTLSSKIDILNYEISDWEDRYLNLANDYPLNINNNISVMDVDGNLSNLDDLLKKEKHTIIFRYNERGCQPCLSDEIEIIKNGINDRYNLILLCNFYEFSDFIDFCRVNQFNGKAYLIRNGSFSANNYELSHIPYYVKFKFNKYVGFYVPVKNYRSLTLKWFDQ